MAKLPAYALPLRPWVYAAVRQLPLGLGLTHFETDYPITQFSHVFTGLTARQMERLGDISEIRIRNSERLREATADNPGILMVLILAGAGPVYPRYPVLLDRKHRTCLVSALERAGIGATASYPKALIDVAEVAGRLPNEQRPHPRRPRSCESNNDVANTRLLHTGSRAESCRCRAQDLARRNRAGQELIK